MDADAAHRRDAVPPPSTAVGRPGGSRYRPAAYRAARRQAHHADAHAGDAQAASEPAHGPGLLSDRHAPLVCRAPGRLLTRTGEVRELVNRLHAAGRFAYDSEFIGELSYAPKLCLIQVATPTEIALIDPLAGPDLTDFWRLLADPSVEKIVHAGQQDIEPVVRFIGAAAANLFDTQIAAGFAGLPYPVGLSKLLLELLGARIGKSMTFTQWDARPLSATQLRYAADDVRFLPALREELAQRVAARGHSEKAAAEFAALCEPSQYRFDPDRVMLRVKGSGSLTPNQLRVLRELVIWRDDAARQADVPARTYLKDEVLVDLARSPVRTKDKLAKVKNLPRPVIAEEGDAILAATARGLSAPPLTCLPDDRDVEPTPSQKFQADALWAACQSLCHAEGIDPQLVSSRQEIGRLVAAVAEGRPVPDLGLLRGWRKAFLGERALQLLAHGGELRVVWEGGLPRTAPGPTAPPSHGPATSA